MPDARALLLMGRAMVDLYCASFAATPERITLDLDDTFDAVHGGLKSDQVKRLKDLETENARLRRAVSNLTLDKMILTEAARGNF